MQELVASASARSTSAENRLDGDAADECDRPSRRGLRVRPTDKPSVSLRGCWSSKSSS